MRTLRNRRRGKATKRGGYIVKVDGVWTNRSEKSDTQAVNDYRRMEEETMRVLAKDCKSADSDVCLRDEGHLLIEEYQKKCDAYQGYEDDTTFSELLAIKDTIGELIRLRVQDSSRFPVKLTATEKEKKIRKAHRDRITYWSTIYTAIKKLFDAIRERRHDSMIAPIKEDYERLKTQLPLDEAQCKSIKDAYEQTSSLIVVLEKEDALMGNGNEDVIAALKVRNVAKKEWYDIATNPELPDIRKRFAAAHQKYKDLGLEDVEEKTRQERQSQMLKDSILRMDREAQRQLEEETEKAKREAKEKRAKEMVKEAAKQKEEAIRAEHAERLRSQKIKHSHEEAELEAAIQKTREEEIIGNWKHLSFMIPHAITDIKDKLIMFDTQIQKIMNSGLKREEKLRRIKEITNTWEAFLSEENDKIKRRKTASQRAEAKPSEATKLDTVEDVYRWDDIQDQIDVLPDSELKTQLIDIDSQINALVYSSTDSVEMNVHVKRLMDKGELLIQRDELIKETKKIHDVEERANLMRNNSLLDAPDLPVEQMKKIIAEWKEQVTEAHVMQTHREKLPSELFQQLVHLKEEKKLIDPLDPRLKVMNMHNGLIDKLIYKEPPDIGRIADHITKWSAV
jgi:hypothetical protein